MPLLFLLVASRPTQVRALAAPASGGMLALLGTRTFGSGRVPEQIDGARVNSVHLDAVGTADELPSVPLRRSDAGRGLWRSAPTHLCVVGSPRGCPYRRAGRVLAGGWTAMDETPVRSRNMPRVATIRKVCSACRKRLQFVQV